MSNRTKLQACETPQPPHLVSPGGKPAICDRKPGHKGRHRAWKVKVKW